MPALPAVANVVKVAVAHTYGTDADVISRFFLHYSGDAPSVGELDTFSAAVDTAWAAHLIGLAPDAVVEVGTETIDLSSATGASGVSTAANTGTRGAAPLSADACALTSYEIVRRFRGGHARGYWPLGVEGDISTPQTWDSGFVGDFQTGVDDFITAVLGDGWALAGTLTHVSVSYYDGFTVVVSPTTGRARNVPKVRAVPVVDAITGYIGRSRIASQRRRLGR